MREVVQTIFKMDLTLALILTFSPQEKEQPAHTSVFSVDGPANPVASFSNRRRAILLLLGEKAGVREVVQSIFKFVLTLARSRGDCATRFRESVAKPDAGMRLGRVRADGEKLFPVARVG